MIRKAVAKTFSFEITTNGKNYIFKIGMYYLTISLVHYGLLVKPLLLADHKFSSAVGTALVNPPHTLVERKIWPASGYEYSYAMRFAVWMSKIRFLELKMKKKRPLNNKEVLI